MSELQLANQESQRVKALQDLQACFEAGLQERYVSGRGQWEGRWRVFKKEFSLVSRQTRELIDEIIYRVRILEADVNQAERAAELVHTVVPLLVQNVEHIYDLKIAESFKPSDKNANEDEAQDSATSFVTSVVNRERQDLLNGVTRFKAETKKLLYPHFSLRPRTTKIPIALFGAAVFLAATSLALDVGLTHGGSEAFMQCFAHSIDWALHSPDFAAAVGRWSLLSAAGVSSLFLLGSVAGAAGYGANKLKKWSTYDPLSQLTKTFYRHIESVKPKPKGFDLHKV